MSLITDSQITLSKNIYKKGLVRIQEVKYLITKVTEKYNNSSADVKSSYSLHCKIQMLPILLQILIDGITVFRNEDSIRQFWSSQAKVYFETDTLTIKEEFRDLVKKIKQVEYEMSYRNTVSEEQKKIDDKKVKDSAYEFKNRTQIKVYLEEIQRSSQVSAPL